MRISQIITLSTLALSLPAIALAAPLGEGKGEYMMHGPGMMWGGDGMGGFGMFFGFVFMLILIAAVIVGTILLLRYIGVGGHVAKTGSDRRALDILEERFAKGEIDTKEFQERKTLLAK
ncbi:MAG: hypothetical protein WBC71_03580 [Salaquimonas sp.]